MVFWGIKLKPKRPFFLDTDQYEGGKLRITNATPGKASDKRAVIKCRAGEGSEICICSLKPGSVKTIQLDLEFEEPVQFSLSGSAPVYLSGFFYDDEAHDEDDSEDDEEVDSDYEMGDFINDDEDDLGFDEDDDDELDDDEEESDEGAVRKRSSVRIVEIEEDQAKAQQTGPKLLEAPTDAMKTDQAAEDVKQAAENEKTEDEDGLPVANKRKITSTEEPSSKKSKTAAAASNDATTPESGKKKKKKEKKKQKAAAAAAAANGEADESPEGKAEQRTETPKKGGKKSKKFPNGLEIEDLGMAIGKPDGKQAKPGKKVSIFYIGKLKSNGKVFDSNIGKRPLQFRLGVNEVVKGFDVGVTGMRIGDKRRVTVPPAMGYGSKSFPGIPPNSWLVFDIELVDVKG